MEPFPFLFSAKIVSLVAMSGWKKRALVAAVLVVLLAPLLLSVAVTANRILFTGIPSHARRMAARALADCLEKAYRADHPGRVAEEVLVVGWPIYRGEIRVDVYGLRHEEAQDDFLRGVAACRGGDGPPEPFTIRFYKAMGEMKQVGPRHYVRDTSEEILLRTEHFQ